MMSMAKSGMACQHILFEQSGRYPFLVHFKNHATTAASLSPLAHSMLFPWQVPPRCPRIFLRESQVVMRTLWKTCMVAIPHIQGVSTRWEHTPSRLIIDPSPTSICIEPCINHNESYCRKMKYAGYLTIWIGMPVNYLPNGDGGGLGFIRNISELLTRSICLYHICLLD